MCLLYTSLGSVDRDGKLIRGMQVDLDVDAASMLINYVRLARNRATRDTKKARSEGCYSGVSARKMCFSLQRGHRSALPTSTHSQTLHTAGVSETVRPPSCAPAGPSHSSSLTGTSHWSCQSEARLEGASQLKANSSPSALTVLLVVSWAEMKTFWRGFFFF